ncbi:hypothetical protein Tco_1007236, partial [Tanacetum coccineum]
AHDKVRIRAYVLQSDCSGPSNIMGIEVDSGRVSSATFKLGCLVFETPFLSVLSSADIFKLGCHLCVMTPWCFIFGLLRGWRKGIVFNPGCHDNCGSCSGRFRFIILMEGSDNVVRMARETSLDCSLFKFKWVWRFLSHDSTLWTRVIKAIHGDDENIDGIPRNGANSCWVNIINEIKVLAKKGINLMNFMRMKLGNRVSTLFWDDGWCKGGRLKVRFC